MGVVRSVGRLAVWAALVVSVAGCSTLGWTVSTESRQKMRSIAVASGLGTQFHGVFTGITVFNNSRYDADVREWNIDSKAADIAVSLLDRQAGRSARAIALDGRPDPDHKAALKAAREVGADTLVLLSPTEYPNQSDYAGGYGYYRRSSVGGSTNCIYSLFAVSVYDVGTESHLASAWGFPMSVVTRIPCYQQDAEIVWKEAFSAYSATERVQLRDAIIESITPNATAALQRLGLIPER